MTSEERAAQIAEFAQTLCLADNYRTLLATIVQELCTYLEADNILVWILDSDQNELRCEASRLTTLDRMKAGEVCPADAGILSQMLQADRPRRLDNLQATRHLSVVEGEIMRSAMFAPMRNRKRAIGVLEAINKRGGQFTDDDAELLGDYARLVAPVVAAWLAQETMDTQMLNALTRLTNLFDVSQSFNSTIEMDELVPIITSRTANVMEAESCSLWLVKRPLMVCHDVYGNYREDLVGQSETDAGTIIGDMLRSDKPIVVDDRDDPRLIRRRTHVETGSVQSLICAPVKYEGQWLGAIEVADRLDGKKFTEDDGVLLAEVAGQVASALRNAERHEAERKVKELKALLHTSREITSTLDLDRMLAVVVNQVATLIPFDRCAIALINKGRYQISAIAGESEVRFKDPQIKEWNEITDWAGQFTEELYVSEENGEIKSDRPERREKFRAHFNSSGMKSLYILPLKDEEGPLGLLTMESQTPDFLSTSHLELLRIFAGQATVALRNAQLYRQVPLIGALKPIAEKQRAFLAMPKAKRAVVLGAAALVLLVLVFFPWNLKVGGRAYVLPTRTTPVSAQVEGIIAQVNYNEGDIVPAGAVVATLRGDEQRLNLNEAQARHDIIARELTRLQAVSGAASAQIERVKLDQTQREIAAFQTKVEQTQIRAQFSGVIVTPRLEEKRGRFIQRGEVFCETADINPVVIETAVPEDDIGLVNTGQEVWLKANAFPERKFTGRVTRVSPQATIEEGDRVFIVRAEIDNPNQALRTGMIGRVKILTGDRSVGYVLLREPMRWLRKKLWQWTP